MKKLIERVLIKVLKSLKVDLLAHAHVQIGVGHNTYFSGEEHVITEVLADVLNQKDAIFFDVGANIGDYAALVRTHFKDCNIHCFEPVEKTFQQLSKNLAEKNIVFNNFGLSDKNEQLALFIGDQNEDGSMATAYPSGINDIFTFAGNAIDPIDCEFLTLDYYCKKNEIEYIDFLKIDVEGHELRVLTGAEEMIKLDAISVIQFEFNEFNIASKSFLIDFYKLLPFYQFFRIMPNNTLLRLGHYQSINEIFRYQNILAVNSNLNKVHTSKYA